MKRLLDCTASDLHTMTGRQLKQAIQASEGRVLLAEVNSAVPPLYSGVTHAEVAAAFGADLILLNCFDVLAPAVAGLQPDDPQRVVEQLKRFTGRLVGLNLEPVDSVCAQAACFAQLPPGRTAGEVSFAAAKRLGFDFLCLTGNPQTGVTNAAIASAIAKARQVMGEEILIIAGKMHGAGVPGEAGASLVSAADIAAFVAAGADVVLLPAPGTIPGITLEFCREWVQTVHQHGALALVATGTSQEGADTQTIRQIALYSKMAGADLHHLGDAGYTGIAVPENILQYSLVIRGRRHTYLRMARSILR